MKGISSSPSFRYYVPVLGTICAIAALYRKSVTIPHLERQQAADHLHRYAHLRHNSCREYCLFLIPVFGAIGAFFYYHCFKKHPLSIAAIYQPVRQVENASPLLSVDNQRQPISLSHYVRKQPSAITTVPQPVHQIEEVHPLPSIDDKRQLLSLSHYFKEQIPLNTYLQQLKEEPLLDALHKILGIVMEQVVMSRSGVSSAFSHLPIQDRQQDYVESGQTVGDIARIDKIKEKLNQLYAISRRLPRMTPGEEAAPIISEMMAKHMGDCHHQAFFVAYCIQQFLGLPVLIVNDYTAMHTWCITLNPATGEYWIVDPWIGGIFSPVQYGEWVRTHAPHRNVPFRLCHFNLHKNDMQHAYLEPNLCLDFTNVMKDLRELV